MRCQSNSTGHIGELPTCENSVRPHVLHGDTTVPKERPVLSLLAPRVDIVVGMMDQLAPLLQRSTTNLAGRLAVSSSPCRHLARLCPCFSSSVPDSVFLSSTLNMELSSYSLNILAGPWREAQATYNSRMRSWLAPFSINRANLSGSLPFPLTTRALLSGLVAAEPERPVPSSKRCRVVRHLTLQHLPADATSSSMLTRAMASRKVDIESCRSEFRG